MELTPPKIQNVRMLDKYANLTTTGNAGGSSSGSSSGGVFGSAGGGASTVNLSNSSGLLGTLYLTATHLIFVDQEGKHESWILHSHLASIEKHSISTIGTPIHIRCKNFCSITFLIPRERDAHDLYTSLYQISQPIQLSDLYCFKYTASLEPFQDDRCTGWNKFDLDKEYRRQGVLDSNWRPCTLNEDYKLCDTYPNRLYVPATATDALLQASAKFRSKGRLPVLSYFYRKNGAVICRCSQPLAGFSQRSVEDEDLLRLILEANPVDNPQQAQQAGSDLNNELSGLHLNSNQGNGSAAASKRKCLYVVDTRPKINAMANRAAGKGYENENFYANIKFHFFGIENIHVMRGSLQKLIETCELKVPSIGAFLSGLQASGWLKHIRSILETARFVSEAVESGISVVVHCSDGWDRTAQTCSIASLLLDSYYRTIDGFQALIQKEWLNFGHKFNDRCGHIQIGDSKEVAPVFTQFIDAVWQITCQHPFDFEFNERFLMTIHDHVYSCQFGTFIGNSEKERKEIDLENKTFSFWAFLESHRSEYVNPLYVLKRSTSMLTEGLELDELQERRLELMLEDKQDERVMDINLCPQLIRFWRSLYNRFDFGVHPRESCEDLVSMTYNHIKNLQGHILYLEQAISNASQTLKSNQKEQKKKQRLEHLDKGKRQAIKAAGELSTTELSSNSSIDLRLSMKNDSSFDSIDSPLKVVQECMMRLQLQHEENKKLGLNPFEGDYNNENNDQLLDQVNAGNEIDETNMAEDQEDDSDKTNISYMPDSSESSEKSQFGVNDLSEAVNCIQSMSLDWQSFRNVKECSCGSTFTSMVSTMLNCWFCGQIFCIRCMDKRSRICGFRWPDEYSLQLQPASTNGNLVSTALLNNADDHHNHLARTMHLNSNNTLNSGSIIGNNNNTSTYATTATTTINNNSNCGQTMINQTNTFKLVQLGQMELGDDPLSRALPTQKSPPALPVINHELQSTQASAAECSAPFSVLPPSNSDAQTIKYSNSEYSLQSDNPAQIFSTPYLPVCKRCSKTFTRS